MGKRDLITKHSPGPFSIQVIGSKTYIVDSEGQRIAHILRIGKFKSLPVEANAELFAAAGGEQVNDGDMVSRPE